MKRLTRRKSFELAQLLSLLTMVFIAGFASGRNMHTNSGFYTIFALAGIAFAICGRASRSGE